MFVKLCHHGTNKTLACWHLAIFSVKKKKTNNTNYNISIWQYRKAFWKSFGLYTEGCVSVCPFSIQTKSQRRWRWLHRQVKVRLQKKKNHPGRWVPAVPAHASVQELRVSLCPRDDNVHPDPHGLCRGSHHVVEPVVSLNAEGQGGVGALKQKTTMKLTSTSSTSQCEWNTGWY